MHPDDADKLIEQLRVSLSSPDEADVEVKSGDDGRHYVILTIKGGSVVLQPENARYLAEDLYACADEAELRDSGNEQ